MSDRELRTEILVCGGGVGGVAAALAALRLGRTVVLTEESPWLGGQLTSQAVPPDENAWIDETGCTASYRAFRDAVRDTYLRFWPVRPERVSDVSRFNPGGGYVSKLCHEPRVALAVLEAMLLPYRATGRLTVLMEHEPHSADHDAHRVRSVTLRDRATGDLTTVRAAFVLDATELGDLLPLASAEHVVGAEGRDETGELHAPERPDPLDQQAITWCFAAEYREGEEHTIARPDTYDFWRSYHAPFWPAPQLSWITSHHVTLAPQERPLFQPDGRGMFHYRRIRDASLFAPGLDTGDVTLVNWPQNDYWLGALVGVGDEERDTHLRGARELSLCLLYWMQTEAPRHDGGQGYPELRPRGDLLGTDDGLALRPYIRESRRVRAEFTVLEQHVGVEARPGADAAEVFSDTVGVGQYRIDLHPSTAGRNYVDVAAWPFQIPLGALLPVALDNLLPAAKNLGVTHITNGCYRLHPVEWNVGEVAGLLAAWCLSERLEPRQVRAESGRLRDFQALLTRQGVQLAWPDALRRRSF